ncbi:MAG: M28 family peptidase [Candidatus Roizmanbacteria bacterium]
MIKDYIKKLEYKNNLQRRNELKNILQKLSAPFTIQQFRTQLKKGENIIVDYPFNKNRLGKKTLLTTHYDTFLNSPGANDNGSGVAVLLEIIKHLINNSCNKNLRFVFFDLEERIRMVGNDVNGSTYYVKKNGTKNIDCVYNLEMVGIGNSVLLWPINDVLLKEKFLSILIDEIKKKGVNYQIMRQSAPLFNSDHLPFIRSGFKNVVSLTTNLISDKKYIDLFNQKKWGYFFIEYFKYFLFKSGNIPYILKHYHNSGDRLEFIEEKTLKIIFDLLWNCVIK